MDFVDLSTKNPKTNSLYLEEKPTRKHRIVYLQIKRKIHQRLFATERFIGKHTYNEDLYERDAEIIYDSIRKLRMLSRKRTV